jgi:hypothetical protein
MTICQQILTLENIGLYGQINNVIVCRMINGTLSLYACPCPSYYSSDGPSPTGADTSIPPGEGVELSSIVLSHEDECKGRGGITGLMSGIFTFSSLKGANMPRISPEVDPRLRLPTQNPTCFPVRSFSLEGISLLPCA